MKLPITKTGELRYFEIIKLFVLVSFFYAFISFITDNPAYLLSNVSSAVIIVIYSLLMVTLLVLTTTDLIAFITLVKSFIISITFKPVHVVFNTFKDVYSSVQVSLNKRNTYNMLCVIRC